MTDPEKNDLQEMDIELTAIRSIMSALAGLDATQKDRVLDYVFRRLGLASKALAPLAAAPPAPPAGPTASSLPAYPPATSSGALQANLPDVRSFGASKKPSNDIERVAIIAYYLAEIGIGEDKKGTISSEDITKYFKQAGFPLPARPRQTLHNAKNAGYLDAAAESGSYKLNPVGHNLVAHGLPATAAAIKSKPKKKAAKKATRR